MPFCPRTVQLALTYNAEQLIPIPNIISPKTQKYRKYANITLHFAVFFYIIFVFCEFNLKKFFARSSLQIQKHKEYSDR